MSVIWGWALRFLYLSWFIYKVDTLCLLYELLGPKTVTLEFISSFSSSLHGVFLRCPQWVDGWEDFLLPDIHKPLFMCHLLS